MNYEILSFDEEYIDFLDDIADIEYDRMPQDKENGKYYIGTYTNGIKSGNRVMVMDVSVTPQTFFDYSIADIRNYLLYYTILNRRVRFSNKKIEIMQLKIAQDGTYHVVLKTFWLRIIQRIWRRVYRALRARGSIYAQRQFEIRGRWNCMSVAICAALGGA